MACSLRFYGDGISFRIVLSQSFWLGVLPGGARLVQPRWMSERRILGGGRTCGVSFWPLPNSSGWWWLISSVFLSRTSCPKTTHANGYYGAWSGWMVSISVLPLTVQWWRICFPVQGTWVWSLVRARIPHATEQLSPRRQSMCRNERSHVPQLKPDTVKYINL